MVRECPRGKTWGAVTACLAKHGTPKLVKELRGYQPNVVGAFTYRSGGLRTAYLEV